jgi:hypothetical protein
MLWLLVVAICCDTIRTTPLDYYYSLDDFFLLGYIALVCYYAPSCTSSSVANYRFVVLFANVRIKKKRASCALFYLL